MAKNSGELSPNEINYIQSRSRLLTELKAIIHTSFGFNVGDFLIAFRPEHNFWGRTTPRQQIVNSHGIGKKYKVVNVCPHGIPYIKELNKVGKPIGVLICPLRSSGGTFEIDTSREFEVDPSYADALIFNEADQFNAADQLELGSQLWNEIQLHNKSNRVNVNDPQELVKFLQTIKVGDLLWKSIRTNFTILSIDPIPVTKKGELDLYREFGEAQDHKGNRFKLSHKTFKHRAIYTKQPRTFKEVRDPK